ncbi:hypothetical protein [Bremerella sp. P1]|uniref:hypothetical protein n=1 Tax=Bremerella sp. P1 TaxID=3026424 RepID=UPI00236816F1|nr:hypothetical protein [Bremerella sp. P1]WDI43370.1 hypothetical protein PSR63_05350 [Bremerella sp. P1]
MKKVKGFPVEVPQIKLTEKDWAKLLSGGYFQFDFDEVGDNLKFFRSKVYNRAVAVGMTASTRKYPDGVDLPPRMKPVFK